jgi:hypothetical protein
MNLDQAWGYVSVLADITLAKKVVIITEDDQIVCNEWGVYLSKTKIDRKSIRGNIQIDGWLVEQGGMVSSSRFDEPDDFELNEIGSNESFSKAAQLFISTIFNSQLEQVQELLCQHLERNECLIESERIVVNDHAESSLPSYSDFSGFNPEIPEDFNIN